MTDETSTAILSAAWELFIEAGRVDASMAEIGRRAGVTRQTVYLAFRSRAGLLIAMARQADAKSTHSRRMADLAAEPAPTPDVLLDFAEAWLNHLPEIFPVGRLLVAAAVTDADAAVVLRDRMEASLLAKYATILRPLAAQKRLRPGLTAERAADIAWSMTHLDAWRHLVVERGWTPEEFREDRLRLISHHIFS
ncbi:MAG: helix-turn-helix domain-containing protein [Alphaproteobacteria bacterium]